MWFLLAAALLIAWIAHRFAGHRDISREWMREDDRRRRAMGYEGVSFDGPFHDDKRDGEWR